MELQNSKAKGKDKGNKGNLTIALFKLNSQIVLNFGTKNCIQDNLQSFNKVGSHISFQEHDFIDKTQ